MKKAKEQPSLAGLLLLVTGMLLLSVALLYLLGSGPVSRDNLTVVIVLVSGAVLLLGLGLILSVRKKQPPASQIRRR